MLGAISTYSRLVVRPANSSRLCRTQSRTEVLQKRPELICSTYLLSPHEQNELFRCKSTIQIRGATSYPNDKTKHESGRTKLRSIAELMRWHKPTGSILALMPSIWALGIATPDTCLTPDLKTMAIFSAGAVVARGMGCTVNDILDRNIDCHVERTKMRPIACGDISAKEAVVYLVCQSFVGLGILCLNNIEVIKLGLFSGFMIASYPLFKRFTYWPQIMLGLTMNWGVLMGYAAINGAIHLQDLAIVLPIYLSANLWTLYYDTIYAHQDKVDDKFIGVKSSALKLGSSTKPFLYATMAGMMASLCSAGVMTSQTWPFYASLLCAAGHQINVVQALNLDDKEHCWRVFDDQKYIGFLIAAGVLTSVALKCVQRESRAETDPVPSSI